jgi:glycosyltransferase involved in cell wall biosynthesis
MDISIVITTYNYSLYIEECINSCLSQRQSSLKYEVIVVDDGSTDNTQFILRHIENKLLRKFRIGNSGIEKAANFGFRKARGRYIVRVDADDKLLPDFLYCMGKYLKDGLDFYYSDYEVIDSDSQFISRMNLPEFNPIEIRQRGDFLATGTIYPAKILKTFSYYSEDVKNSGLENYEFILRLVLANKIGKRVPHTLFCYRRHVLNISTSKKGEIMKNGESLFQQLGLGSYRSNQYHPYI